MTNPFIDLFRENAQRKPAQNPFTQVFAEPDTGESPERLAALSRNPIAPPAVMGEAAKLGRLFDLPADVVARNIDEVRSGAADPMANWRRLTEDAPKTAAWMQDPINHSLASDNVEPLSRLERLIGRYSLLPRMGAVQVGNVPMPLTQFQQTAPGLPQQEFRQARETQSARGALALIPRGLRTEAQQMQLDGLTARQQEELSPSQSVVESFAREAAKILPSYVAMAEGAAVGTAVVGLAAVAGAPIALTLGTAASIGAFGNIFLMEAGNAVADFENVRDEQGRRIGNDGTAYALGLTYGVASTALERVGFGFVADPFMVAGKRFIAPAMTTALTAPTMRTALFEGAKAYGAAIVGETVTETLQTGLQLIGENDYRTLARWGGADVRGVTADDALDALKETAVSTAMGMAVLGVPGAGLRSASELGAATEAVARRDRLASAFEIAIPDAVRERDPERFRELVRASAEGQSVYIDAARATILLQEANLSPEEFTAAAGISMQDWNQATAAGTDLAIPVASLITDLAPTPLGDLMLPDLSYSLGGMTAREAEGMLKDAEAFKERVRKEAEAVGTIEESDPAYRIVDDLRAKLEAAGRTPAVAMVEAQAAAKPYIVWAKAIASKNPENPMADPWTLYSRKGGLGIIGGERAEATFDAVMAVSAARKRGAPAEEIAALESRVQRLADERVQIRAVLEEADQLLDVRDEGGRLRSSLRNVSTDALVIEFIRLRDIVQNADAELSSLEARQEAASAGANTATAEEQVGVLSEAGIEVGEMGNVETWAGKLAAYQRYLRSLRSQVRKVERSVPRLMRELEARGVTAPDLYARENQLGGTFVVPTDIPFQRGIDSVALLMQAAFHGTDFLAQEGMQTETLGETIDVDGVSRPTTNSTGQPIHPTAEGVRNFWRWFGDSKVVDAEGRPLVVYHGTDAEFTEFDANAKPAGGRKTKLLGDGFYFATERSTAAKWGKNVMPVYLRIENPRGGFERGVAFPADSDAFDGVIAIGTPGTKDGEAVFVARTNTQVKSALGNSGAFGPSADILMQEPLGAAVTTGDLGTMNVVRGTRVTADNVVLSKEEEQAVVAAVKEIKRLLPKMKPAMTKQDVAQYVREVKAAFPESDGWAPLEFKGIDPSQTNKDNNGKIEYKWGNVSYSFNRALDATQGLKVGTPEYEAQVSATANALVDEVRSVVARAANGDVAAKRIIAQRGWYKNMRQRLRQEFGGLGDVFADFLGALSPNTPVRENWKNAVDFLRRATEGAFDELIPQWEAWSAKVAQEEIAFKAWFDQQLVDRQMSATKFRNTPEWKARKAEMSKIRELPAELLPTKANGKKYGFNGKNAVRATLNLWRVVREADVNIGRGGQAPKALNFSGNLIGFRAKATIDVWAARMLQRLTGRVRVPPPAEQGVGGEMLSDGSTTGAFGYGQEVFARAAEAIRTDESLGMPDMGDDDLQAVVWFVEKELWTKNNWTSAAGEGGSFEFEADLQGVADVTRVDDLRRVMDSSKSTPEQREEAAAELTKLARTVDRYTVGLSIQQSGGIQGVDVIPSDDAQSVVLQGLRAAIYATTNPESVLATKAVSTEGRYFGEVERAVDVEAVVREGFDPTPLWREIVRVAQANNQDSAFLSRVLRAEETMDPTRHRPGIELYLSTTDTTVLEERIAAITAMLVAQDINGFTITMDGRATGTVEGQPGRPIGVRLQYVPEFDRRYSAEVQGLTEDQIAAKLQERGDVMADLAVKLADEVPDVSFAGRFFYETRVAFSHQYAEELADGTDDAVAGSEGGARQAARRWEGRLLGEGIAATDRQLGIARADAERQAQSRDATRGDTSGPEGVALLEQRTGNRPNAYFLRTERVIGLMAGTNLSSVMHEMSHEYLATLEAVVSDPDVPEWLKQDFEVAVQAIGIEAGERDAFVQYLRTGLASDQKTLNRFVAAEEKWARSFESYLEKGEAPSRDLLRAFATFRVWFGQVYRALRQMLIPVSPELRGVFDRMLATDEEIAEYRQFPESAPLFTERPEGMTDAQWTEYTKGFRTRDALAGAALVKRILSETRAVVSQDWENKKAEVEASIREELAFDPLVQAVEFLRVGTDGEPMKLDRALLNVIAPDLWKSFPKGTTAADGVMTLDAVALKYGFPDALSLATALQGYQEVKDVVAKRLAETFRREYGDLLGDSTAMAEAVSEATHKAETDEPLVRELKALGQQLGMRVVDKPALVQLAREMLAKMRVSDIQPSKYELAEAREARASEAALRKGNTEQAAFHKRRQLLNRILVRESRTAVAEVEKIRAFALRMSKDPAQSTLGKAGESFTDAMNAVLAEYEFARVSRRQIGRREALDLYVKDVEARGGVPMLSDAIRKDASLVNYRALPLEELAAVDAAMRQIWHHAKTVNTIASEGRKISLEQAAEEIAVSLEKHRPQVEMNTDGTPISLGKSKELVQAIDAWHLPPTFLFRWLDGDNYGATWRLFFEPIQAAENAELTRLREASKRVTEIEKMVDFPPFLLDVGKSYDGIRSKLTRRQVLALAMNWGNASSRQAVLEAKTGDKYPQFGSASAIEAMFASALTEQDWKYVHARWDYANEFWPEIADLERRMTGIVPDKIEAAPFMIATKDGKTVAVRGGYYPLSYDRKLGLGKGLAKMGADEVETDLGSLAFVGGARAQTKHGWTNERTKSAEKPIDLSLGVWNRHIQSVIHDLTHREAVRDVYALWQREDVRVALVRASGQEYYDSIKAWLVRVANPMATVGDSSYLEKVLQLARVGTTTVNLGLKFSSGVAQTLGYVQSLEAIGPKWMSVGMGEFMPDMARAMRGQSTPAIDFVMASSPMMANRKFNYNRDVADYARSKFGKLTDLDAFNFWFIGTMDGMVSFPTWIGAYRKAMAANGNDHDAAVRVADDTVESSQGAGAAKDLARIQGGTELRKLMTMHYTAFSRMFGQFRRATTNRAMGKYGTPRFLAAMTALWFGQVVLGELLGGRWPDDDEEPAQFWLWKIMSFPASFFIGIRDLVNALGPNAYGYKLTPAEAAFERTTKAANAVYRETLGDLFHGADREMTEAEARALVEAPGYWFRLPTKAIWQYGDYLMDWAQGEIAPANPVEMMRGLLMNQRPE